jgi:hypothetical protein
MLRHIVPLSLAVITCAALVPTKVNAVTLSIGPSTMGEIQAKPGDLITFTFRLRLDSTTYSLTPKILVTDYDHSELSPFAALQWLVPVNRPIAYIPGNVSTDIATLKLKVDKPVRDKKPDVWGTLTFDEENNTSNKTLVGLKLDVNSADVVPVPEPLTMLGAAAALGYGAILKRKYSKKTEF